jgi:ribulose kinase
MLATSGRLVWEIWPRMILRALASVLSSGNAVRRGLCAQAAHEMGLPVGTPVAVGMIDAHAGGIGTVRVLNGAVSNMAYVFGTSSCTMTTTPDAVFVPGVWGPYYSAMVPGCG